MESIRNQDCLISTLMRLRESSKDAVVSADYVDELSVYMHVDRPVQEEFEKQLKNGSSFITCRVDFIVRKCR